MDQERFKSGRLSTSYIKDEFPDGFHGLKPTQDQERILIAAAMAMHEIIAEQDGDPSDRTDWIVMIDKTAGRRDRRIVVAAIHVDDADRSAVRSNDIGAIGRHLRSPAAADVVRRNTRREHEHERV